MMVTEQRTIPVGWLGVTAGYPSRAILNRAQCVTVAPGIAVCVVLRSTAALDETDNYRARRLSRSLLKR